MSAHGKLKVGMLGYNVSKRLGPPREYKTATRLRLREARKILRRVYSDGCAGSTPARREIRNAICELMAAEEKCNRENWGY